MLRHLTVTPLPRAGVTDSSFPGQKRPGPYLQLSISAKMNCQLSYFSVSNCCLAYMLHHLTVTPLAWQLHHLTVTPLWTLNTWAEHFVIYVIFLECWAVFFLNWWSSNGLHCPCLQPLYVVIKLKVTPLNSYATPPRWRNWQLRHCFAGFRPLGPIDT